MPSENNPGAAQHRQADGITSLFLRSLTAARNALRLAALWSEKKPCVRKERIMRRLSATYLGFAVALTAGAMPAGAQYPGVPVGYRGLANPGVAYPAYSPYLNLLRQGNPFYANYYGLVRPEVAWRQSVAGLQSQTAANQQSIAGLETAGPLLTGHGTSFLNTSHYFMYRGPGTPAGRATGGPQPLQGQQQAQGSRTQTTTPSTTAPARKY
jgi:hypothetical protein